MAGVLLADRTALPRFLTVSEVAEALRVSERTAYRLVESGGLPTVRIGPRGIRVSEAELVAYIEARSSGAGP